LRHQRFAGIRKRLSRLILGSAKRVDMVKALEQAIEELSNLPDVDQEQIGRRLLWHVEKLRRLRAEIDKGIQSLDAGKGEPLDIEESLRRENDRYGRA
jgi:hypothetical protein